MDIKCYSVTGCSGRHSSAAQRFKLDSNDEVTTDVGYESLCPRKILRTREVYNTDGLIDDRSPLTVKSFRALDLWALTK